MWCVLCCIMLHEYHSLVHIQSPTVTVFTRVEVATTINFECPKLRLLFEQVWYSVVGTINFITQTKITVTGLALDR